MTLFFFFSARSTLRLKINLTPAFKQSRLPVSGKENSRNTVYGYKKTWSAHISVVALQVFFVPTAAQDCEKGPFFYLVLHRPPFIPHKTIDNLLFAS